MQLPAPKFARTIVLGATFTVALIGASCTAPAPAGPGSGPASVPRPPTTTTTTKPKLTAPTTTAPTTTAPPASSVCGEPSCAPRGDLPGWRQVFRDDFTTDVPAGSFPAATGGRWGAYSDDWIDSSRRGRYQASAINVDEGALRLPVRTIGGVPRVAAAYPNVPGAPGRNGGQLVGRFAMRLRADVIPGYKFASLLWPDSERWPHDGEIDYPEGDFNGRIMAFTHRQGATVGSDQDWFATTARWDRFHTYVIERTETSITYLLDGQVIGRSTQRLPNSNMHWVLQAETSLDQAVIPAWASGEVEIDWVSVWSRA